MLVRYSVINDKNPREIVLLRGSGCKWKRCAFCDYHTDFSEDENANFELNSKELNKVTGIYNHLEVINSGSFCDLDEKTIELIEKVCQDKKIKTLHFECHWIHRKEIPAFKARFFKIGVTVKIKSGIETFDYDFREKVLIKGIGQSDPAIISKLFDECCLLFGIKGQTLESMKNDIEIGLKYFERICINLMVENTTNIHPDNEVLQIFIKELYPLYIENPRVDILIENTDFGVG